MESDTKGVVYNILLRSNISNANLIRIFSFTRFQEVDFVSIVRIIDRLSIDGGETSSDLTNTGVEIGSVFTQGQSELT